MDLNFDFRNVVVTSFGVGRDGSENRSFVLVPPDAKVQAALREMAEVTWAAMRRNESDPDEYQPSEKHAAIEYLYLSLDSQMATAVRDIHSAASLDSDSSALGEPTHVFCYFARFTDARGRRLTAIRRATQFKGILKSRNRLVRMIDDTLRIIEDSVFKLDQDFDLLVDNTHIHILRPSGFEFVGQLQQAILDSVPENIRAIKVDIPFVDFAGLEEYATKHPRAARYLASISVQEEAKDINKAALKKLCKRTGVEYTESLGVITVSPGHEMGFLEVLDRRRNELELVKGRPERFKAGSRTKLNG